MHTKWFGALVIGTSLVFSHGAMAEDMGGSDKKWEEVKKMSPEEREKFHAERKAKWDALSDSEKVKLIEEKRAKRRKEMDEKWKSMSDPEKVKFAEERMKRKRERREKCGDMHDRGPKHGLEQDDMPKPEKPE